MPTLAAVALELSWLEGHSSQCSQAYYDMLNRALSPLCLAEKQLCLTCRFYTQLLPYLGNTPRLMAAGPEAVVSLQLSPCTPVAFLHSRDGPRRHNPPAAADAKAACSEPQCIITMATSWFLQTCQGLVHQLQQGYHHTMHVKFNEVARFARICTQDKLGLQSLSVALVHLPCQLLVSAARQ